MISACITWQQKRQTHWQQRLGFVNNFFFLMIFHFSLKLLSIIILHSKAR